MNARWCAAQIVALIFFELSGAAPASAQYFGRNTVQYQQLDFQLV